MNDDRTLDGVERLVRDATSNTETRDSDDERWEALAMGTASDQDIQALEAEATISALAAEHLKAYRPIDHQTRQQFLERVQVTLDTPSTERESPSGDMTDADSPTDSEEPAPSPRSREPASTNEPPLPADSGRIVPWPQRHDAVRRWLAPAVAALAATLLWTLWPQSASNLPEYVLTAEAGRQAMRSAPPEISNTLELELDDPFEITLRPAVATEQPVTARVYAERAGGLELVEFGSEVSDSGSIRLAGHADPKLIDGAGHVELWIVIAARTAWPDLEDIERHRGGQPADANWQLLRCRLRILSRGET